MEHRWEVRHASSRRIFRSTLDASGRILLPSELRKRLHVVEGDAVLVIQDKDTFELQTLDQAVRKSQDYFCSAIPAEVNLADELLAERREEAAREAGA